LEEDIASGVEITQDMLFEKVSPISAAPGQTISAEELANQVWYSKIPLARGTVMQSSVLTDKVDFIDQVPAGFVITSILVEPQNAAAGKIIKGDYIDIAATSGNDISTSLSKVILQRVLVLDVTVSPNDIAETANSRGEDINQLDSGAVYAGKPSMYLLAVSSSDFARLALIRDANLYLGLSAKKSTNSDTSIRGGDLFLPGNVVPSTGGDILDSDGEVVTDTGDIKQIVEAFFLEYSVQDGVEVLVINDEALAIDASETVIARISLGGGSLDTSTGQWSK
jgi:hypothetical protein